VEEVMPKKVVPKTYLIHYKSVNNLLKVKKKELEKLQKKVNLAGKVSLELQIKAIALLLQTCKNGKMTSKYTGG
jgi:hypothetical protein